MDLLHRHNLAAEPPTSIGGLQKDALLFCIDSAAGAQLRTGNSGREVVSAVQLADGLLPGKTERRLLGCKLLFALAAYQCTGSKKTPQKMSPKKKARWEHLLHARTAGHLSICLPSVWGWKHRPVGRPGRAAKRTWVAVRAKRVRDRSDTQVHTYIFRGTDRGAWSIAC
jgi:hypothetical protein